MGSLQVEYSRFGKNYLSVGLLLLHIPSQGLGRPFSWLSLSPFVFLGGLQDPLHFGMRRIGKRAPRQYKPGFVGNFKDGPEVGGNLYDLMFKSKHR